jgi:hypothetical protein
MSAELVRAVNTAVAYVKSHSDEMTRSQVEEFEALAADVYKLAVTENLLGALPQVPELRPELEMQDPKVPAVQFISKLNLPGDWCQPAEAVELLMPFHSVDSESPEVGETTFLVCATPRWLHDMQMLSVVAGTPKAPKAKDLDSQALKIFFDDPALTKKQIAEQLGKSTQSLAPNRCPRLQAAMDAYQEGQPRRNIKGTKGADRSVEAWDEE